MLIVTVTSTTLLYFINHQPISTHELEMHITVSNGVKISASQQGDLSNPNR